MDDRSASSVAPRWLPTASATLSRTKAKRGSGTRSRPTLFPPPSRFLRGLPSLRFEVAGSLGQRVGLTPPPRPGGDVGGRLPLQPQPACWRPALGCDRRQFIQHLVKSRKVMTKYPGGHPILPDLTVYFVWDFASAPRSPVTTLLFAPSLSEQKVALRALTTVLRTCAPPHSLHTDADACSTRGSSTDTSHGTAPSWEGLTLPLRPLLRQLLSPLRTVSIQSRVIQPAARSLASFPPRPGYAPARARDATPKCTRTLSDPTVGSLQHSPHRCSPRTSPDERDSTHIRRLRRRRAARRARARRPRARR